MSNRRFIATLLVFGLVLCTATPAADAYPYRHGWYRPGPTAWRGGFWNHGWYGGRFGWWWVVGGVWYFYAQPVYPYPDLYVPPDSVVQAVPTGVPPPQVWYYCEAARAYYPYVSTCPGGWRQVPSTPPPTAAPTPPPPVPAQQAPVTPPPNMQALSTTPPSIPPASTPPV